MTSERKIAANRINGRKSRGPRTPAGKARASRNALRHGLAAIIHRNPTPATEIEQIARAICGDDNNPLLFEAALRVAESQLLLRCIHAQQVAVIERLQDGTAVPLVKGDNAIALAKARSREGRVAWAELLLIKARVNNIAGEKEEGSTQESIRSFYLGDWSIPEIDALENTPVDLERLALYEQEIARPKDRDEVDAICEALPDLKRLERYERQAWSRLKSAFREFIKATSNDHRYERDAIGRYAKHARSE